jgi:2,3-dihydroxybiphenyl 1,2-dioxygenase
MTSVTELAYIGIEASDLDAWQTFAVDLLGMQVADRDDRELRLRLDDRVHRIIVRRGTADDLAFSGYECRGRAEMDSLIEVLVAHGSTVEEGDAALASARGVDRIAVTQDPQGNRLELVVGLATADSAFGPTATRSGFFTQTGGAGHMFVNSKGQRQAMIDFYALLGFQMSDYINQEIAPGMVLEGAFTHCNPRHHTLAFADMPFPKALHHFLVEVNDMMDVGLAFDRVLAAGQPLEMTLGVHSNDRMFSFYVRTPSGFSIEYGWGGLLIADDQTWDVVTYDRTSKWGHQPPALLAKALTAGEPSTAP